MNSFIPIPTDGQILSVLNSGLLDKSPNELFGYPAIQLNTLYQSLETTFESLDARHITALAQSHSPELLDSEHKVSLKSVRKGQNKDYWIVFQPLSELEPDHNIINADSQTSRSQRQRSTDDEKVSNHDDYRDGPKTVELLSDLPGGEGYDKQPKSSRRKLFNALGLKKVPSFRHKASAPEVAHKDISVNDNHVSQLDERDLRQARDDHVSQRGEGKPQDWLEDTRRWQKKPERKGTEFDIIASYDHSDVEDEGEDQDKHQDGNKYQEQGRRAIGPDDGHATHDVRGIVAHPAKSEDDTMETKKIGESPNFSEAGEYHGTYKVRDSRDKIEDFPKDNTSNRHDTFPNSRSTQYTDTTEDHSSDNIYKVGDDDSSSLEQSSESDTDDGHYETKKAKKIIIHDQHRDENDKSDHGETIDAKSRSRREDIPENKSQRQISSDEGEDVDSDVERERAYHTQAAEKQARKHHSSSSILETEDTPSASHKSGPSSSSSDKQRKHKRKSKSKHQEESPDSEDPRHISKNTPPTPFLVKAFEDLPFEPDTRIFDTMSWLKDRWQLVFAELLAVFGMVYIIQATGL
ncbi:uncharacterized protein IL334_003714 [Kwoniella shivajii]|uniref:Uncharacterized protein n=1 Tax=Kwoniella shivajii TaxID=564305 RepID=A0ABZ1CYN9_9TREE|nr:hypothetical protein IL334_003714 [Kwoniella shivajii]